MKLFILRQFIKFNYFLIYIFPIKWRTTDCYNRECFTLRKQNNFKHSFCFVSYSAILKEITFHLWPDTSLFRLCGIIRVASSKVRLVPHCLRACGQSFRFQPISTGLFSTTPMDTPIFWSSIITHLHPKSSKPEQLINVGTNESQLHRKWKKN